MKKIILGFDVSSSVIGWAVLNYDSSLNSVTLIKTGNLKPPKKDTGDLSMRLSKTYCAIEDLINIELPDEIVVEDYAKRFSAGRSTANVIIILSVFNEIVCLASYKYLKSPVSRYPVVTIRATLGKFFNKKIISKDDVYPVIVENFSDFKQKINKKNNISKESFDEVDAISVGMTHLVKKYPNLVINTK